MEQIINVILPLLIGYSLDLLFGDPRKLPHPIVGFGNIIGFLTKHFNKGRYQLLKGAVISIILTISTYVLFSFAGDLMQQLGKVPSVLFASIIVFYGLANKSLLQEGAQVFQQLEEMGLDAGRKRLSWIVGRDTTKLSAQEIRLAVFETLSENLSDGVVAPLFYYAIGGFPAMMCYKMINTMDSMIGYKNEKYIFFGRFAARLDDIANFFPARITALLMAIISLNFNSLRFVFKYGKAHTSPNSGYPEAALAGILNCRFGGPHEYNGLLVDKPFIGENDRMIESSEINKVKFINHAVCLATILIIVIIYFPFNSLL